MTEFIEFVKNQSRGISTFIRACLLAFVAFGPDLTDEQIAALLAVVESGLVLFQYSNTVSNSEVEEKVDEKVAHREMISRNAMSNLAKTSFQK